MSRRRKQEQDPVILETPKTFVLLSPIKVGKDGNDLLQVELCEPTAGDIEQLQRDADKHGPAGAVVMLIAKQSKLPPVDVRKFGARDFRRMEGYLSAFLESTEETSES